MNPSRWSDRRLAMALGVWMPVAMVAIRLVRFGSWSDYGWSAFWSELLGVALFYMVGCLAATTFLSSFRRHARRRWLVYVLYFPFLPASVLGALMGGLFGPVGVIVYGTIVFIVPWGICRMVPVRKDDGEAPGVAEE